MRSVNLSGSSCHHCRHCRDYQMSGRRDGNCQQLSVTVKGNWKACPLFVSAFTPDWEAPVESNMQTVLI
ncbi:MAG: hypothetical protein F6K21_39685 [Symploca sp. SIO2D2]|nr:hypothetical protein [Symploca sp. SIO2D2]NER50468.1 hypothetical protein [Symploca sp. SIO1A3]